MAYCPKLRFAINQTAFESTYLIFTTSIWGQTGVSYRKGGNQDLRREKWPAQVLQLIESGAKTQIQASWNINPKLYSLYY